MKFPIIIFFLTQTIIGTAQDIFIQPNIGYRISAIYNEEDLPNVDYTDLKMKTTLSPQGGLFVGYQFRENNLRLSRIMTGVSYSPIRQKYDGNRTVGTYDFTLEAQTDLNYIQVPLIAEFAFLQRSNIQPILQIGASYNYLLSYTSYYTNTPYPHFWKFSNDKEEHYYTYSDNTKGGEYNGKLSDWLYEKSTINFHAGAGFTNKLSDRLSLSLLVSGMKSVSGDVENKKKITFTREFKDGTVSEYNYSQFDSYISFTTDREDLPKRNPTFISSLGLQLGLIVNLTNNKSIFKN